MSSKRFILMFMLCALIRQPNLAQQADFSHAVVLAPQENNAQLQEAATVLRDVIGEHTNINLPVLHKISNDKKPVIFICIDKTTSARLKG